MTALFFGHAAAITVVVDVPAIVAPRPSASLAGPDSAPKLIPAMVINVEFNRILRDASPT